MTPVPNGPLRRRRHGHTEPLTPRKGDILFSAGLRICTIVERPHRAVRIAELALQRTGNELANLNGQIICTYQLVTACCGVATLGGSRAGALCLAHPLSSARTFYLETSSY